MITGAHVILYSKDPETDRAFFCDVLGFPSVDAGHGWLIFALPPAEAAFHPAENNGPHELYLMCGDLEAEMRRLSEKGVTCSGLERQQWGLLTRIKLPGGGDLGLYQPRHKTAVTLA